MLQEVFLESPLRFSAFFPTIRFFAIRLYDTTCNFLSCHEIGFRVGWTHDEISNFTLNANELIIWIQF